MTGTPTPATEVRVAVVWSAVYGIGLILLIMGIVLGFPKWVSTGGFMGLLWLLIAFLGVLLLGLVGAAKETRRDRHQ